MQVKLPPGLTVAVRGAQTEDSGRCEKRSKGILLKRAWGHQPSKVEDMRMQWWSMMVMMCFVFTNIRTIRAIY